jgi:hypothetical protein
MAKFQVLHNLLIILCLFVLFILFKIIGHSTCNGVLFAHIITLIRVAMLRATLRFGSLIATLSIRVLNPSQHLCNDFIGTRVLTKIIIQTAVFAQGSLL